jgi:hypothetical protein
MVSTYTSVLPTNIILAHVVVTASGNYYRFENQTSGSQALLKEQVSSSTTDDSAFTTTTISFSVTGTNVTITKGTGQSIVQLKTLNGNYYRFDTGITILPLQGADTSATFGTSITFTAA